MTDQQFEAKMNYFYGVKEALGYDTVWSMYEVDNVDQNILKEGIKRVCYVFYAAGSTVEQLMNDTAEMIEVSAFAASGSVRDLWAAAESCFQQAKAQGDWHCYIEDLELRDDGSFELVMGS
jgi:hypothetical protein